MGGKELSIGDNWEGNKNHYRMTGNFIAGNKVVFILARENPIG